MPLIQQCLDKTTGNKIDMFKVKDKSGNVLMFLIFLCKYGMKCVLGANILSCRKESYSEGRQNTLTKLPLMEKCIGSLNMFLLVKSKCPDQTATELIWDLLVAF